MSPTLHTCKNCSQSFSENYCNHCGEKLFTPHDKSLAHLFEEGLHFISHFEGKLLTTVKTVLTQPGRLSLDYCSGIQKKYYKPLSFFLLLVVIYILFPVAKGLNMPLGSYVDADFYGSFARRQIIDLMSAKHFSQPYVFEHFQSVSEKVSKLLLLLIIPIMALWNKLLTYKRSDKVYFDHFIFCTEVNAFLVLWGFLIFPLLFRLVLAAVKLFTHQESFSDLAFAAFLIVFIGVFTFIAAKRFYRLSNGKAFLFTLLFISLYVVVIQYVYKFMLFYISLHLVH